MLNKILLQGRLTKDPELRHTQIGKAVCSFTLAVKRDYKGSGGSEQTDFIDCVAWEHKGEFVSRWFHKGEMMIVCGRLESRDWQDTQGNKRRSWEIICESINFCDKKANAESQNPAAEQPIAADDFQDVSDDGDVPF